MISVAEAKKIISDNVQALTPVSTPLKQAAGLTLAEDVFASIDIPAFPQSSMDGYAIAYDNYQKRNLTIIGEVAAGSNQVRTLDPGTAVRIFTGAPVPEGADTVVMQEKVKTDNGILVIEDEKLQRGINVRPKGSEIKAGALALEKDTVFTPAAIGFLAGIGTADVKVYPAPSIAIIITGNELQQPGSPLEYGQVYESTSYTLSAVLQQLYLTDFKMYYATDDPGVVTDTLRKALKEKDLVVMTGGISVGDYDFVLQAVNRCGVEELFHKVKQRPGKPLYVGKKDRKLVFGLPGNPSSVLTCFYQYVVPAIEKMCKKGTSMQVVQAPLSAAFQSVAGLTQFAKGYYNGKTVTPLPAQESYRLSSFAKANCLIEVKEEVLECKQGDWVNVHLLHV